MKAYDELVNFLLNEYFPQIDLKIHFLYGKILQIRLTQLLRWLSNGRWFN